jgi:rhodanese-related sulfurtransferase
MVLLLPLFCIAQQPDGAKSLSTEELKKLVDSKQKFFFLDVREAQELEQLGTLKGYVHIPLGEVEKRLKEVPQDQPIVIACQRGRRAAQAAAILEKNGYKNLSYCGLAEWQEKKLPLIFPKAGEGKK